jgi:ATP-dependent DNA helicase RecG
MIEDIHTILERGEGLTIEFKTSFTEDVIVSLVAFSNAKGGTVYVGITDKLMIKGVILGKETVAGWLNEIKNKTTPAIIPNVDVLEFNNQIIVALSVVEYPVKPIAYKGRYYQRIKNSNHLLSAVEISNLSLQSRQHSWDSYEFYGAKFVDLNHEKIVEFIRKVNNAGRFILPENAESALEKLGMLSKGVATNAAMILFSKNDLHYNVHIGRFKTPTMIVADKMISGNLYDVIEESMKTIISHLKFAFDINITNANTQRTEIPEYPLDALRELLLNAIIHRDYQSPTDVQIKIFDTSISFFNPSGLFGNITIEDLKTDTYRASTRNKQLAEALYLTKDIEKYGSGFSRIRKEIADYPSMTFNYRDTGYGFFAEFVYETQKVTTSQMSSEMSSEKSSEKNSEKSSEKSSENILNILESNPKVTIRELSKMMGMSTRMVEKHLKQLTENACIIRKGGRKLGYWQVL